MTVQRHRAGCAVCPGRCVLTTEALPHKAQGTLDVSLRLVNGRAGLFQCHRQLLQLCRHAPTSLITRHTALPRRDQQSEITQRDARPHQRQNDLQTVRCFNRVVPSTAR